MIYSLWRQGHPTGAAAASIGAAAKGIGLGGPGTAEAERSRHERSASRIAALPIARPIPVHAPAVRSAQQGGAADAVARRNEPVALAGAESFDRCMPVCESRDPLIARAAVVQATYRTDAMIGGPFDDSADEHAVLDVGREVAERIVDLPHATLDTGRDALARLVRMVE